MATLRTQVGIVGAGPAGLLLAHLLHPCGIDSIVIERPQPRHIEARIRAGSSSRAPPDLLTPPASARGMDREGLLHDGFELSFRGARHRIDLAELTGRAGIMVYGQHEVVKDLVARTAGRWAARSCSRSPTSACTTSTPRRRASTSAARRAAREHRLRLRRRLRRVSRRLAAEHPGEACHGVTTDLSRSVVRHPGRSAARSDELIYARHDARLRARVRMRSPELQPALLPMRARRRCSPLARRAHLGGAARAPATDDGWTMQDGRDLAEGHHADAQLRRRADAARPAFPRRRRRAHRAAHRRQGHEPRGRRRPRARPRLAAFYAPARSTCSTPIPDGAPPGVAGAALLLVDDLDAAPVRRRRRVRRSRCSTRNSTTTPGRSRAA